MYVSNCASWRGQFVDTLQFQNQHILDKQVNSVTAIKLNPLVLNRLWMLNLESNIVRYKFVGETLFKSRFKQPWANAR